MTEWEHLYCKLLLINKIIEGDEVILKKRSIKSTKETVNLDLKSDDHLKFFEERQHHRKQMFHNKRSSQEFTVNFRNIEIQICNIFMIHVYDLRITE